MPTFPTTGLVSYWKLDESSGTRVDSHGTNHLTPTNAPVGAAGKLGNGCDFESSSSQYLSHADPLPLGDEDFTYTAWFKREALGYSNTLIGKDSNVTGRVYILTINESQVLIFNLYGVFNLTIPIADTNWHFVVAWHDSVADTIYMQLDNGSVVSQPTGGAAPVVGTGPVYIGARDASFFPDLFDGLIDEVGLWRRVLTAQERTDLYNGGAGLAYAPPAPPVFPTANLVSYWRLDEASGTRVDSHGTNHLTPTNAPVGAAGKIGNGCDFEFDSSQRLSHASNSDLAIGGTDLTFTAWIKFETVPVGGGRAFLLAKDSAAGREYGLVQGATTLRFEIAGNLAAQVSLTPVAGTGYFLVAGFEVASNTASLQLDNGAVQSTVTDVPSPSVTEFWIGARQYAGLELYVDGLIDEVGLWRRVLTAQERTDLFNGGAGLAYAPPAPPVFPTANLVSYWRLDEASGTRVDSHGTNHLTPTNAPVGAAGKIGNGCDFESSSSQYLSHADPAPLGDESWTYTLWFKFESVGSYMAVLAKGDDASNQYFVVYFNVPDGRLWFTVNPVSQTVLSTPVNDTNWHFLALWHDATANEIYIQTDNGAAITIGAYGTYTQPAANAPVFIGARQVGQHIDGLIDEVGLWRRVLTAQERTDLYNGGAGLAYSTGSGESLGGDLTTRFATYLKTLRAASPGKDLTTLVAKDLPVVRAAHPLPTEVDDRNTLYNIHLD